MKAPMGLAVQRLTGNGYRRVNTMGGCEKFDLSFSTITSYNKGLNVRAHICFEDFQLP